MKDFVIDKIKNYIDDRKDNIESFLHQCPLERREYITYRLINGIYIVLTFGFIITASYLLSRMFFVWGAYYEV